jgi:hypothetical protein
LVSSYYYDVSSLLARKESGLERRMEQENGGGMSKMEGNNK